jgi:hypothetical protein
VEAMFGVYGEGGVSALGFFLLSPRCNVLYETCIASSPVVRLEVLLFLHYVLLNVNLRKRLLFYLVYSDIGGSSGSQSASPDIN